MKTFGAVLVMVVCLAAGFAGFKAALVREHSRLERNKQIISRMLKDVWSNPDTNSALKVADELFTSDFVLHDWTGDSYGLENHKKGIADNRYPRTGKSKFWKWYGGRQSRSAFIVHRHDEARHPSSSGLPAYTARHLQIYSVPGISSVSSR